MGRGGFSGGSSGRSSSGGSSSRSSSGGWGGSSRGGFSSPSGSYSSGSFGRSYSSGSSSRYYDTYGHYYGRSSGCGTLLSILVVIFIIIYFMHPGLIYSIMHYVGNSGTTQIVNTVNREPLQKSALKDSTSIIQDEAHWLDSQSTVKTAMDYFRSKTGVQPMLIIAENLNGRKSFNKDDVDKYLEEIYNSRFKDEAHIILYFCEPEKEKYFRLVYAGTSAANALKEVNKLTDVPHPGADSAFQRLQAKADAEYEQALAESQINKDIQAGNNEESDLMKKYNGFNDTQSVNAAYDDLLKEIGKK